AGAHGPGFVDRSGRLAAGRPDRSRSGGRRTQSRSLRGPGLWPRHTPITPMSSLLPFLHRVASHQHLSSDDARTAMLSILDGEVSVAQMAAFLTALRMKEVTAEELTGFARAMRERSVRVEVPAEGDPLIDTCGTGGDGGGA